MKMRAMLATALLAMMPAAWAQEAQVTFSGEMIGSSCAITVNRGSSTDGTVQLVSVPSSDLHAAGERSRASTFYITVGSVAKHCLQEKVQVEFSGPNINPEGRLANTGTARNVDVVVMYNEGGGNFSDINLLTNAGSPVIDVPDSTGWARISLAAAMHATAAARGGSVSTTVGYTIIYP
ncbi:TPA: type 1 fimbrial protein [Stenotrophomonas maltophilia]|nr:type 1 fimbrial protein [Stenotrophomonas maltophilia]